MERRDGQGRPGAPISREQGRGQKESKERQQVPNVWDVLERKVMLWGHDQARKKNWEEYSGELRKYERLRDKVNKKLTDREKLTRSLFNLSNFPLRLSLEGFQQFRSNVKLMSDDEVRKEIRRLEEQEKERRSKLSPLPSLALGHPRVFFDDLDDD